MSWCTVFSKAIKGFYKKSNFNVSKDPWWVFQKQPGVFSDTSPLICLYIIYQLLKIINSPFNAISNDTCKKLSSTHWHMRLPTIPKPFLCVDNAVLYKPALGWFKWILVMCTLSNGFVLYKPCLSCQTAEHRESKFQNYNTLFKVQEKWWNVITNH